MNYPEFEEIARILTGKRFTYASTMPNNPHYYTLRKNWDSDRDFVRVVEYMRREGYVEKFRGRPYTMLNINQYKYWTMGAPIEQTILINRKPHLTPAPYDSIADIYEDLFKDHKSLEENRELMEVLGPAKGWVLDIGCGAGILLDYQNIPHYTGIDPSRKMLERMQERHPETEGHLIHARFEEFYTPLKYDTVISLYGTTSYIEAEAIWRIPGLLNPGGRFFLMFYKTGYTPETYRRSGHFMSPLKHDFEALPGELEEFGNYYILSGTA